MQNFTPSFAFGYFLARFLSRVPFGLTVVGAGLTCGALLVSATGNAQTTMVMGTTPARHTAVLEASAGLTVQFSQPITAATANNLRVFGAQRQGRRTGAVAGGGTAALAFSPSQPFAPGEQVRVSVPASLQSATGSGVAKQVLEFTVAAGGTGQGTFTGGTEVVVGAWPTDIVTGDVDGDGDLDFVTVHDYLFRAAVGFNNGDGTYTLAPYNTIVGGHPTSVALGDVDGDGDLDMLVTDAQDAGQGGGAGSVSICTNDGKGQFLGTVFGAQSRAVGVRPSSVALGDVDADGDLDFVAANAGSNSVSVRLNNGVGTFSGTGTVAVGAFPQKVVLGDVDNDGDLDLLTANATDNTVSLRLNAGNGTFSGATTVSVGAGPEDVVLADLDGNGSLDFATINDEDSSVSVRLNTGAGTFTGTLTLPLPAAGSALVLGDIDADGDADLVAAGRKNATVFLNNGSAAFTAVVPVALGLNPSGLALADVDADGDLDLLASNEDESTVSVRLNGVSRPPIITSFTPSGGRVGTTVVLTGTGLSAATQVRFNGIPAPNFTVDSDARLTVSVPAGATSGPLTVTTPLGTTTSAASYVVQVPPVVTTVAPARNTVAAARSTTPQITFSEPMTAVSADNVRVFGSLLRGRRAGTVTGGGTTALTFSPAQQFAPGELVSVSVPATVEGPSGGVTPHTFQFRAAVPGVSGQANFTGTQNLGVGGECAGVTVGDVDNDGDLDLVATTKHSSSVIMLRLNDGSGNFPVSREIPTDFQSQQALLSDLDADGDLDLLVSSSSTGKISLRLNDGHGSFSGTTALVGGEFLAVGDIDADGDQDILSADSGPGPNVFFNNGNATFTTGTYAALDDAVGLALADVDNDGDLDVVTTHGLISKFAKVGLNDGRGSFTPGPAVAVGAAATAVALADLDGDQDVDLVTVHRTTGRLHVQYNDGRGQFGNLQAVPVGPEPTAIELADVDADGDLDLVVPNYQQQLTSPNTVSVRLNDGHGGFAPAPSAIVTLKDAAYQIALGDLDNDGDLDLLTANAYGNSVSVRFNQPTPAPVISQVSPVRGPVGSLVLLTGRHLVGVREVRFNGQAASYYIINSATQITVRVPAAATTGPITVVSPAGTGTSAQIFTVTQPVAVTSLNPARNSHIAPVAGPVALTFAQPMQTATDLRVFGSQRQGLRSGSLTGAGTPTVAFSPSQPYAPGEEVTVVVPNTLQGAAGSAVQQVYQFRAATSGSGTGNFVAAPPVEVGQLPLGVALGDVDNDGDLDLVSSNARSETISIRRNNGQGSFSGTQEIIMPTGPGQIKLADMDNDQDLDIVISLCHCSWGGTVGEVAIQLNDGTGNFTAAPSIPVPGRLYSVNTGDLDNDGDLDIVLANYSRDSVYVRLNNGQARFSGTHAVAVGTQPKSLVLGDVDNDGDLDLVVANGSDSYTDRPNIVSVRLNNGLGFFSGTQNVPVSGRPQSVTLGDVDNDGDLDLVASTEDYQDKGVSIGLNNGQGVFSAIQTVAVGRQPEAVLLGDIDADGDLDLLTSNVTSKTTSVRLNDGQGVFSAAQEVSVGSAPWEMALGDIDADGDLDLVSVDDQLNSGFIKIFLNSLPAPVLSSFTPTTGEAGTVVTLTGRFFTGASQVTFNGVAASFTVVSATQVTANVPATATTGLIKVTTPYGTAVSATPFVLPTPAIASFTPTAGGPGLVVTLRGNYFTGATGVSFGTVAAASFTVVSATEVTAVVPEGATTATIRLTSPSGTGTSASLFTVLAAPVATTWAPGPNASHVPPTSSIEVAFSRAISAASAGSLRVFGNQRQGQRTGTLTGGGTAALRFVPAQPFAPGEQISVSLPASLLGTEGGRIVKRVFQFRAAAGGPGRGTFAGSSGLSHKLSVNTLRLGDMDGNGDLDIVTNSGYNQLSVVLNQGNGTFATPLYTSNPVVSANPALQLGDFDGDGDLDVATYYNFGMVAIRLNDGRGNLSGTHNVASPDFGGGAYREVPLEVGDIDADGDLDLVTGSPNRGSITALLNDGHGIFSPGPQQLLAVYFTIFRLGDVDNDGDLDLVAIREHDADPGRRVLSILLNDGDGGFTAAASLPLPTVPTGLKLADMDQDGTLDAVITDYEDLPGADHWGLTVLRNNGAARFTVGARRALPASGAVADVLELGDVDADGDVDALTSGQDYRNPEQFVRLFLNDGRGRLNPVTALPTNSPPIAMALGDLDGDGDLDLTADGTAEFGLALRLNGPGVPLGAALGNPLAALVTLYPNPANRQFTVELPAGLLLRPGTLSLVNSLGQVMHTQALAAAPAGSRTTVRIPGLAAGLYLVRLSAEGSPQVVGHLMID
ncbi:T9SS C-terminal target domain-containing protein [Hymenobacter sediminis]|uniref:FG-GAP-like repeat-containing protein n=1 Tax=Hymenobacter sediminis TaxID=2218621 RepID=UPI000F4E1C07|nr:FG-GAP-like repeat-containing protein [Hymenobacter sediminis]RPD47021.1 T9SS C-terminal target domain-containing protein [Hymenobacter sediminis]